MKSIWQATLEIPSYGELRGDVKTQAAVVGGGIAGLMTAYFLKCRGVDCILLEKDRILRGTTCHTTGKITAGQGLIYGKISSRYGRETAQGYYLSNAEAVRTLCALSSKFPCDLEQKDNYVYSHLDRPSVERETRLLDSFGAPVAFYDRIALPLDIAGAVCLREQAQFNPLRFLAGVASELKIYENSFVREINENEIITDGGRVMADNIVVATHFPFINSHGLYFLKLYQHRSYVLALENAPDYKGMYINEGEDGLSFRNYGDYLLLGGGGHRTGKKGGGYEALRRTAADLFPAAREKYAFAAQDCMSLDGIPYIGRYFSRSSRLFVATGFNKWGMCGATVAARLLADEITGVRNDYSEIFSAERSLLHRQLLLNTAETVVNMLFPTTKRCAHLGCALHYNKAEHSWDCACHGSRFAEDGRVIDNPSQKDCKSVKKAE